jgi:hypothetical protein
VRSALVNPVEDAAEAGMVTTSGDNAADPWLLAERQSCRQQGQQAQSDPEDSSSSRHGWVPLFSPANRNHSCQDLMTEARWFGGL